uniref:Testis expressed 2 n=1 Tax=Tetraodon nigroviridis TaxID=99883 RepID=H3CG78_TETNG
RHRQLVKTLVKSLSSDTSQDSSSILAAPYRLSEARLNLQLFKQFTQSRTPPAAASTAGNSKTAPCSPLTSPERGGFFKVSEVEARFEDTRRRLSEVISEPLQLLSKIMDEKSGGGGAYRPKALSASASELSNGQTESNNNNNNYCIKEEDAAEWGGQDQGQDQGQGQDESQGQGQGQGQGSPRPAEAPAKASSHSVSLENCSMSALARQEDEDFCVLYCDDYESAADAEAAGGDGGQGGAAGAAAEAPSSAGPEEEPEPEEPEPGAPLPALGAVALLVYGYFVLPLPGYVAGLLLGAGLGFLLAVGVVWLTGLQPQRSRHPRDASKLWTKLDIKEPEMYKGWMNEMSSYDPELYHATLTHSVFVRLEGSVIRLSKPNHNIARRAANEAKPDVSYVSQKIYDLSDSRVYLLPHNLARKRVWNKKYPICIDLGKQDDFMSKAEGERSEVSRGEERSSCSTSRELTLYLFGRTGREKEEWFQHFLAASRPKADQRKAWAASGARAGESRTRPPEAQRAHSRSSSRSSLDEALTAQPRPKAGGARVKPLLDYGCYMATMLPQQAPEGPAAPSPASQSPQSSPGADKKFPSPAEEPSSGGDVQEDDAVSWVNAPVGRVFWDFLSEPHWADVVSRKIQMKLSKIRLPYFMNELTLTELDMGSSTPRILKASKPSIDYRGLWFSLDVSYSGSFLMTLETKMNLIRLGKEDESGRPGDGGRDGHRPRTYCLADSDEESSSAGSSDEEDLSEISSDSAGSDGWAGVHKPSKIMRFVDKITKSKYFQKATETEFIKKKMEEVSNTPLLLTVEVQHLQGTLAVNIPPPPTDRIWYGFRTPPRLELKARPKLGEREVTLAHVTDWIERKLDQEFQKIFVMPNMDDVWLSVMHSAMDQPSPRCRRGNEPASPPESR